MIPILTLTFYRLIATPNVPYCWKSFWQFTQVMLPPPTCANGEEIYINLDRDLSDDTWWKIPWPIISVMNLQQTSLHFALPRNFANTAHVIYYWKAQCPLIHFMQLFCPTLKLFPPKGSGQKFTRFENFFLSCSCLFTRFCSACHCVRYIMAYTKGSQFESLFYKIAYKSFLIKGRTH